MSGDIFVIRGNPKVAYQLILQHIYELKQSGEKNISAGEIAQTLQIPYYTVKECLYQLHTNNVITELEQK